MGKLEMPGTVEIDYTILRKPDSLSASHPVNVPTVTFNGDGLGTSRFGTHFIMPVRYGLFGG